MKLTAPPSPKSTRRNNYNELADFVIAESDGHFGEIHRDIIIDTCMAFDEVGQLIVARRDGNIIAAVYFDWLSKDTVDVKEIVVHKDYRGLKLLKSIILKGLLTYPQTKFIRFNRRKYADRASIYHFSQFFKGEL